MRLALCLALLVGALPLPALAAGGHDAVGCIGCHGARKGGSGGFAVPPNQQVLNPRTKQPYSGTTAFCLGCHAETKDGGQGYAPISAHMSHPFGLASVNPRIARVPAELLRDGRFECMSCHDPHPSNPYHKYLRIDTAKGARMDTFCAVCHPIKADAAVAAKAPIFDSMDESGAAGKGKAK
ncbi:MAG TPA: cytochrome c3 family protein [Anaeromyxobacter sp.]|nr:cytochrome c3 family protein [Anaeromyxobacter sp.]